MKVRKEVRSLFYKKEIHRALEDELCRHYETLKRWLNADPTPFYHHSPAIRKAFLKIVGKTVKGAFEPSQTEQETK